MALFFAGYFWLLNNPFSEVTVMPVTGIDRFFGYHGGAWILYISLWIYVQLPPMLIERRRELLTLGATAALTSLVGFAFFYFWPTAVPATLADGAGSPLGSSIRKLDTTGNSCPSLHVAFSVYTAVWLENFLRQRRGGAVLARWLSVVWCLGIVYSTMGVKQHVFIDTIPGAVLGLAGGWLQVRLMQRKAMGVTGGAADLAQINPAARKL